MGYVTSISATDIPVIVSNAPAMAEGLHLQIVRDRSGFEDLRTDWLALDAVSSRATLFQSYHWCALALKNEVDGCAPYICCVYDGARLVGVLPLKVIQKKFRKILTGLAEPFQEFTDMLVAKGYAPQRIFDEMHDALEASGADYVHFGQVRQDSALFPALKNWVPAVGELDAAPFVDLNQSADYASFHKTVRTKTRKNMRNAHNSMERSAPVFHEADGKGILLDNVITRTFDGRSAWLEEKGLTSSAFASDEFQKYLENFRPGNGSPIECLALSLRHGDTVIAEQWGFVYGDRYYAFISNWNSSYAKFSPGKLHLGYVIETCYEMGLSVAEFMVPSVPYKKTWATASIPVQDHVKGYTFVGKIYGTLWINKLRPLVKKLAYMTPDGLRRRIKELLT